MAHPEAAASHFEFHVGNSNDPSSWSAGPAPSSIAVRSGAGIAGTDRVTLIWPDGAIVGQWLQITVKADAVTGLAAPDVFYVNGWYRMGNCFRLLDCRGWVS